jgi:hypothetical protein
MSITVIYDNHEEKVMGRLGPRKIRSSAFYVPRNCKKVERHKRFSLERMDSSDGFTNSTQGAY